VICDGARAYEATRRGRDLLHDDKAIYYGTGAGSVRRVAKNGSRVQTLHNVDREGHRTSRSGVNMSISSPPASEASAAFASRWSEGQGSRSPHLIGAATHRKPTSSSFLS
jgi:hypothetical protein